MERKNKLTEQNRTEQNRTEQNRTGRRLTLLAFVMTLMMTVTMLLGCGKNEEKTESTSKESSTKEQQNSAAVGDIIVLGTYEQDNDTSNGKEPIEWIVLDKDEDGSLLVISKYALDLDSYNRKNGEGVEEVIWENCDLREWLNESFYSKSFDDKEKEMIKLSQIENPENPDYDKGITTRGNTTEDYVFVLNIEEARKYFKDNDGSNKGEASDARICEMTAYASAQKKGAKDWRMAESSKCYWWLRSPGPKRQAGTIRNPKDYYYYTAAVVADEGTVRAMGCVDVDVYDKKGGDVGIRPAMWIKY